MDTPVGIVQVRVQTTSNGRQKFDVDCTDGVTRTVWEANLANALNAFAGTNQQVTIRWSEKQNGQYTNRTIHAFAPPGQALPADNGQGGSQQGGGGFRGGGGGGFRGMSEEDKTRISKMGAQGAAATIIAALFTGAGPEAYNEATELHDKLTLKLYKSARSHEKQGTQAVQTGAQGQVLPQAGTPVDPSLLQQQAATVTPQDVAAAVPGVQVGVPVAAAASDDIDWS
jgi:hypothetical protein